MYRLIQVALDGSLFAAQALPLAVCLARRHKAALQILRVHEPIAGVDVDRPGTSEWTLDQALMERAQAYLDGVVGRLSEAGDLRVSSRLVKGPVAETIVGQAAADGVDLLVMTTNARGPLGRFWFGSIADALVRQLSIPILIVRPGEGTPDVSQPSALRHVLIPLDGSRLAEQAIEPALLLGGEAQAEYTLLRVVTPIIAVTSDERSGRVGGLNASMLRELDELHLRKQAEANEYLEHVAQGLRARSFIVHSQVIMAEQPASAVLELASTIAADVIALTTRGQGGLKRLLLGSVADKVLRGATTPVLICPPTERLAGVE
jgi:nucleotide-binding universal stress UspA family protein